MHAVESSIQHLQEILHRNLCLSYKHQQKFFTVKDQVLSWVNNHSEHNHMMQTTGESTDRFYAFILNEKYAFRHIFKCGGTTVGDQTKARNPRAERSPKWVIGDRKLLATVRDPVDHFLSGWAECGKRGGVKRCSNCFKSSVPYDEKIQNWLSFVQKCKGKKRCSCNVHSMPQANFLFAGEGKYVIDPKLDIIGDLMELPALLELVGFPYNATIPSGNNATEEQIKRVAFPNDKSGLSNSTMQKLCKYVELDYFLFDFEPPVGCHQVVLDVKKMTDSLYL
jgi:hypothetical protein